VTALRIGQACEFKPTAGLGGWRPGVVDGFVGRLISVRAGTILHSVKPSHVRPSREETRPDRGAQQAAARAQRLVMAPPPMDTEEPEEVIPRDVGVVDLSSHAVRKANAAMKRNPPRDFAPQPKAPKPTRSQAYRKHVIMQGCAVTGAMAEDAHHYSSKGISRGMSEKVSDFYCVPLTHAAHMDWHRLGYIPECYDAEPDRLNPARMATRIAMLEAALKCLVAWLETKEGEEDE